MLPDGQTHGGTVNDSRTATGKAQVSARAAQPFLTALRARAGGLEEPCELASWDPDARVDAGRLFELLRSAVARSRDRHLGLVAAAMARSGEHELLEYGGSTAATLAQALHFLADHSPLVTDASNFLLTEREGSLRLRIEYGLPWPRSARDFQLGMLYRLVGHWLGERPQTGIQLWFAYEAPKDLGPYRGLFGDNHLRFDAPYDAVVFSAELLGARPGRADAKLHAVLQRCASRELQSLPAAKSLRQRVRGLLGESLGSSTPSMEEVAEKLQLAPRTLQRRLRHEGTSFKQLLDDARRELALGYLSERDLAASEVASLLGFAQPAAFPRAFKRWTGRTPLAYKRLCVAASEGVDLRRIGAPVAAPAL